MAPAFAEAAGTVCRTPRALDALVLLVPHREYLEKGTEGLLKALTPQGIIYDLKSVLDEAMVLRSGRQYLAL